MHRIDAPGHSSNTFTEGNPSSAIPATQVSAAWLNDVQEEIAKLVEAGGITLVKGTTSQMLAALKAFGVLGGPSGGGIGQWKFPATQNPSGDANTLDDYERGAWTPVIGGATSETGQTYSVQVGRYIKIGKFVLAKANVVLTNKGTITGAIQLKGMPFASENVSNDLAAAAVAYTNLATNWVSVIAQMLPNSTMATIAGATAANVSNTTGLAPADIGNTTQLTVALAYIAGT